METGLNEIFVGCCTGSVKVWPRVLLLVSHGEFILRMSRGRGGQENETGQLLPRKTQIACNRHSASFIS